MPATPPVPNEISHSPAAARAERALDDIILGVADVSDSIEAGVIEVEGGVQVVHDLVSLLDTFEFWFNIVTP
jgi:alkyl sulfatase BDS1-like metallo-beta-lactamase superfamily hydrolase